MVWAEYPLAVRQGFLKQRRRVVWFTELQVDVGEVSACRQGGGVVWAEYPLAVRQGPLKQRRRVALVEPGGAILLGEGAIDSLQRRCGVLGAPERDAPKLRNLAWEVGRVRSGQQDRDQKRVTGFGEFERECCLKSHPVRLRGLG